MSQTSDQQKLKLPASLISKRDLARLTNDFEAYDAALTEIGIQAKAGYAATNQPAVSDSVRALAADNNLNLNDAGLRSLVIQHLRYIKDHAPEFHLRFAASLNANEQQQLSNWFRQSIDSQALLDIGIQPAVIGGVYIRSKNKVYDMSWRQKFINSRRVIGDKLRELSA